MMKFCSLSLLTFVGVFANICASSLHNVYQRSVNETETKETQDEFWKRGIILQIYPRSYYDYNGDGTGDIRGIIAKADYFVELGVEMVWLTPILQSPMKDFGYDISDFKEIDPIFGSMEDYENLLKELHDKGIKVIFDFVPNHTSDQHEWFQKKVVEEMDNVFRFWLDKGVDGFRVDALKHLVEVEDVYGADEPVAEDSEITDPTQYSYLNHTLTVNLPETFNITRGWYEILDSYDDRLMMTEVYDDDIREMMRYYGNESYPISDFTFNFLLITKLTNRSDVTGTNLKNLVDLWMDNMPSGRWPNWVLGNHDNKRVSSRFGVDLIDALNMFILLLPGTPTTYYGEEIGMVDTYISYEDTQDPAGCNNGPEHYTETSRDPVRTPMQWDESQNAGFSTSENTWIPVNENYPGLNVQVENSVEQSHLLVYKELAKLRLKKTFQFGELEFQTATDEVVAFVRSYEDSQTYLIVINTSPEEVTIDVSERKRCTSRKRNCNPW
ncbi:Maltase A1 [Armadillidium nasatum]|uniref:Maltase A1 n=1 Tax=Armadillidium nasatum TaxID=96803 RepID=A0A5N5T8E9_9CRUS|nr:Maltase A1 [Armadillidium nasatum]